MKLTKHEKAVYEAVKKTRWRNEVTLCRQFNDGLSYHKETEDALFSLVKKGLIEWFGPDDKPLSYRVLKCTSYLDDGKGPRCELKPDHRGMHQHTSKKYGNVYRWREKKLTPRGAIGP